MQLSPGTIVADCFRLVRMLSQGGMGSIWLAQHTRLDVPCAVKFIRGEEARSPEILARFEREAKAAAQLRSPHVVQILDHGFWQDGPYIAMEFLEGEDLSRRLRRRRVLPPREVAAIARQIGRALTKAHAAGLVHRDLKPANIFLVHDDDREVVKVLDFGVAKASTLGNDGVTKTGALLGTPSYMSPEQARGIKDIDHRSDLWALAVVVFQCLVGQPPFRSEALGDLFMKIMVEPLPVPSQLAPVPPGFDAWWARAAERDPARRFQSAKELTDALAIALGVSLPDADVGASTPAPTARTPDPSLPLVPTISAPLPAAPFAMGPQAAPNPAPALPAPFAMGPQAAPNPAPALPAPTVRERAIAAPVDEPATVPLGGAVAMEAGAAPHPAPAAAEPFAPPTPAPQSLSLGGGLPAARPRVPPIVFAAATAGVAAAIAIALVIVRLIQAPAPDAPANAASAPPPVAPPPADTSATSAEPPAAPIATTAHAAPSAALSTPAPRVAPSAPPAGKRPGKRVTDFGI